MATLLQGVNAVLKKATVIDAQGELSSITDSARQVYIDNAIASLNEIVDDLYERAGRSKPRQMKEATIELQLNKRDYPLRSDLIRLRDEYPLINEANSHTITILGEDGYRQITVGDLEQDDTGVPSFCAQSPINGRLIMDVLPDSEATGRIYKYYYDRDLELSSATDSFPFSETVFRAVVPAAAEIWKRNQKQTFDAPIYRASLARAAAALRRLPKRTSYMPSRGGSNVTDPMSHG